MTLQEANSMGSQTNWERVDAMTDQDIENAMREDNDSAPELTEDWFRKAILVKEQKEVVPIYLDHSVAEFLRERPAQHQSTQTLSAREQLIAHATA